jgi:exopolysaccharide production protein ExoY
MKSREAFDVQLGEERHLALATPGSTEYGSDHVRLPPVGGWVKRGVDLVLAALALVVLSPVMIVLVLCIKLQDGGPIVFHQERIGHRGRSFRCLKFRSMVPDADRVLRELLERDESARAEWLATHKLKDDPRCTRFGRFMRRTSLDELPQLFNVLRGDMSLVGPRPIVSAETRFYGPVLSFYKSARPGLTGLWQVSGRSDTSYAERVELDVHYVRSWSLLGDLAIIARTVVVVFRSDGSY